jgi:hypothetical protein
MTGPVSRVAASVTASQPGAPGSPGGPAQATRAVVAGTVGRVPTRRLIAAALLCGLAILVAFTVQVLVAR